MVLGWVGMQALRPEIAVELLAFHMIGIIAMVSMGIRLATMPTDLPDKRDKFRIPPQKVQKNIVNALRFYLVVLIVHADLPGAYALLQHCKSHLEPAAIRSECGYCLCTYEAAIEHVRCCGEGE